MSDRETPYDRAAIRASEVALGVIAPRMAEIRETYDFWFWEMMLRDGFERPVIPGQRTVTVRAVEGAELIASIAERRRIRERDRLAAKRRANPGPRDRAAYLAGTMAARVREAVLDDGSLPRNRDGTPNKTALAELLGVTRRAVQHALNGK